MKENSLVLSFKIAALKTVAYGSIAAGAIGPGFFFYNNTYNPLSDERTPVIGNAQYNRLKTDVNALIEKDAALQDLAEEIVRLRQEKVAYPERTQIDKEIVEKNGLLITGIQQAKDDFSKISVNLYKSHGISEQDAINLVTPFQSSPYLKETYTFQSNLEKRLRNLDECQIESSKIRTGQADDEWNALNTCMDKPVPDHFLEVVFPSLLSGMFSLFAGAICLITLDTNEKISRLSARRDRRREEEEAEKTANKRQLIIDVVEKKP